MREADKGTVWGIVEGIAPAVLADAEKSSEAVLRRAEGGIIEGIIRYQRSFISEVSPSSRGWAPSATTAEKVLTWDVFLGDTPFREA